MTDRAELMPCPFCNSPVEEYHTTVWNGYIVHHAHNCYLFCEDDEYFIDQEEISAWNHRADLTRPSTGVQEALAALDDLFASQSAVWDQPIDIYDMNSKAKQHYETIRNALSGRVG